MLWVGALLGYNGSKAKIGLLPCNGNSGSAVGNQFYDQQSYGPEYYQIRTGPSMYLQRFDNDLLQLGYAGNTEYHNYGNQIDNILTGCGMTVAFPAMVSFPTWSTFVRNKIYPTAMIGDPGSNLPNAMWYFYGGLNKVTYDAYDTDPASCPCPFTRALILSLIHI